MMILERRGRLIISKMDNKKARWHQIQDGMLKTGFQSQLTLEQLTLIK
jgi:hypothetical protein